MKHLLVLLFTVGLFAQTEPQQADPPNSITVLHRLHPKAGTMIKLFVEEHGVCALDTKSGSEYAKAHHVTIGKVYGFWIHPKALPRFFSPTSPTNPAPAQPPPPRRILWLCRAHIADMIGTDPETGEKPKWDIGIK